MRYLWVVLLVLVAFVAWPRAVEPEVAGRDAGRALAEPHTERAAPPAASAAAAERAPIDVPARAGAPAPALVATNRDRVAGLGEIAGAWELAVEVVDADGAPVAGARVTVARAREPRADAPIECGALTDPDGRAVLRGELLGPKLVRADARVPAFGGRNLQPAVLPLELFASPATVCLVLREGLTIEGRIERLGGAAEWSGGGAVVLGAEGADGVTASVEVTGDDFSILGLAPGAYTLRATGGCSTFALEQVMAGTRGLVLELRPSTRRTRDARVLREHHRPVVPHADDDPAPLFGFVEPPR